jgi:hypothetical protein
LHADTLQQVGESTGDRLLFRPGLQSFLHVGSTARQLCELHDLSPNPAKNAESKAYVNQFIFIDIFER